MTTPGSWVSLGQAIAKDASIGTDGTAPPVLPGGSTGLRGWLRAIYERLGGSLTVTGPLTDAQLRATPVPVSGSFTATTSLPESDIFGTTIVGQLNNKIEVHFDDTNWSTFVTETRSGGSPVAVQALGRVQFETGTGANGRHTVETLDVSKYRPRSQVYGAGTIAFVAPPAAIGQKAIVGYGGATDGCFVGYKDSTFGLVKRRNSVDDAIVPQAQWNIDKMDGTGPSHLVLDPTKGFIFEFRYGLFGYAGGIAYIVSPYPWRWVPIHYFPWYQTSDEPFFTNFDLPMRMELDKGGSGANNIIVKAACWGAGTTSQMGRVVDPMSDRSLVLDTRSVIWGKATNGSYVPVGVNNQGRLLVSNDAVGVDGATAPTSSTSVGGIDPTGLLQALRVAADGTLRIDPTGLTAQPVSGTVGVNNFPATQNVDRPGDGMNRDLLPATGTVTSTTPLTITPTAGKSLRVWWITATPRDAANVGRITANLVGKGEIYRVAAVGHRQRFDGTVGGTLTVAVTAGTIEVTVHYEEF